VSQPRVTPGTRAQIGRVNSLIVSAIWRASGTKRPPNLFTTLARHRRLFRAWLRFGGALMPRGTLPRIDTEVVILRVASNTGAEYERRHHERMGAATGLSDEQIAAVRDSDVSAAVWSGRQRLLLRACDEMHEQREISDGLWAELSGEFDDVELIELCMLIGHYEMLAMTIASLRIEPDELRSRDKPSRAGADLTGRRVFITGAARGIGAATARRLHERGARVALAGIEPELLAKVAKDCGDAPFFECDVRDREQVEAAVEGAVEQLGGLDVVLANAGVAAQLPILGGNPEVFERTIEVNLIGVYYTLRAAAPHIAHERGYALAISSLAAAVHAPLLGAYSASKAGVEALADSLRIELASTGARVGVAYFAQLDTDMTSRGFGTDAAQHLAAASGPFSHVTPLKVGVDAIERGIAQRSRRVVAPAWVAALLPIRELVQQLVDRGSRRGLNKALEVARAEDAPLTTSVPGR
jgi:NAD(P)-dependent dehydrogenase (short-subunit alcohol dehydrogenase family)/alkylhydroperoxidase family enzyme